MACFVSKDDRVGAVLGDLLRLVSQYVLVAPDVQRGANKLLLE